MITIIDSPCGRGKTTYAIKYINERPTDNFVYITPFLKEVERVIEHTNKRFVQPANVGNGKYESLVNLFNNNKDIVSTHSLFSKCSQSELIQFIYRSRIRQNQHIFCYIPSLRMRSLLYNYMMP